MRVLLGVLAGMTLWSAPGVAQGRPGWYLELHALRAGYDGAAVDRDPTNPGDIELKPAGQYGLEIGLARRWDGADVGLALGYAQGAILANNDQLAVADNSTRMARLRTGLRLTHRLTRLGQGALRVGAGPVFDLWHTESLEYKTTLGGRVWLETALPAGGIELVNTLGFDLSQSPFRRQDLPSTAETRTLKSVSFGVGVRFRL